MVIFQAVLTFLIMSCNIMRCTPGITGYNILKSLDLYETGVKMSEIMANRLSFIGDPSSLAFCAGISHTIEA